MRDLLTNPGVLWAALTLVAHHNPWSNWCTWRTRWDFRMENRANGCHRGHSRGWWSKGGLYVW